MGEDGGIMCVWPSIWLFMSNTDSPFKEPNIKVNLLIGETINVQGKYIYIKMVTVSIGEESYIRDYF